MDVERSAQPSRTLAELLEPYRAEAIAEAVGRSRQVTHGWRIGRGFPDVAALPDLAQFLRMSLEELTRIIADEVAARKTAIA